MQNEIMTRYFNETVLGFDVIQCGTYDNLVCLDKRNLSITYAKVKSGVLVIQWGCLVAHMLVDFIFLLLQDIICM